jgi:hypothetical protein
MLIQCLQDNNRDVIVKVCYALESFVGPLGTSSPSRLPSTLLISIHALHMRTTTSLLTKLMRDHEYLTLF